MSEIITRSNSTSNSHQSQINTTMLSHTDESFNTTMASMSLPSPAATSGWNSSASSDFGTISLRSPDPTSSDNIQNTSAAIPSYDSFDDPISGSRFPSLRSSNNSNEETIINGVDTFAKFNVPGNRRSIDFQSPLHRSSANNLNQSSNNAICRSSRHEREIETYASVKDNSLLNRRNQVEQLPQQQSLCASSSSSYSSSVRSSIRYSLPTTCNILKR